MEIKRDVKNIPGWTSIRKWSIFHDFELHRLSITSSGFVFSILTFEFIQKVNLIYLKFDLVPNRNMLHEAVYNIFARGLNPLTLLLQNRDIALYTLAAYFLFKFFLTVYFYRRATKVRVLRTKTGHYLQIVYFFIFLDLNMLMIPVLNFSFLNLYSGELGPTLASIGIVMVFVLEFLFSTFFCYDFKFFKTAVYQGRDTFYKFVRFTGKVVICFIYCSFYEDPSFEVQILVNFLNIIVASTLIIDQFVKMHFMSFDLIKYSYLIFNIAYAFQSLIGIVVLMIPSFIIHLNLDYLMLIIFMLIINYLRILFRNRVERLNKHFVYDIKSVRRADQYLENLSTLFKNVNNKKYMFKLFSLIKLHFKRCNDMRCLCFLLKYQIYSSTEKRLIDHMAKLQNKNNNLKLTLYDDSQGMASLKREHRIRMRSALKVEHLNERDFEDLKKSQQFFSGESPKDGSKPDYLVNLRSNDVNTVFASFYHILLSSMTSDKYLLFKSYLSFLVFEVENLVGSLISAYSYIFSLEFKRQGSIFRNMIIQNYISISEEKLHRKFLASPYWLSGERIQSIFGYFQKLDIIEKKFSEVTKLHIDYYQELAGETVSYRLLMKRAVQIVALKKEMDRRFSELFGVTENNSKLLSLYINYQLNITLVSEYRLRDYFEKLQMAYKRERPKTLAEIANSSRKLNIFNSTNMICFVNIMKSNFYISKFSSNTPGFFGYEPTELRGKLLSDLMPIEIKKNHDRYLLDFANQRKSSVIKTSSLTSFSTTKNGDLRVVTVIAKLEYYLTNDIYLCGILVPHPRNTENLVLTSMSGKVISMNQGARSIFGKTIMDNPYSLFLSIPLLMKYFYPGIEQHLRYKKFSKRNQKRFENVENKEEIGKNFELETEKFDAFMFKFMLSETLKIKGLVKGGKEGILANFGIGNTNNWDIIKNIRSKLLVPKHVKLLSKVISKNRELIRLNSKDIFKTNVTIETYKHRGNLNFKLIVIKDITATAFKVKRFFKMAARKLDGEMADIFLTAPKDINTIYKILRVERMIKLSRSDSKESFLPSRIGRNDMSVFEVQGIRKRNSVKESTHQGKSKMAQKYKKTFTNQDIYDDSKLSAQNGSKNINSVETNMKLRTTSEIFKEEQQNTSRKPASDPQAKEKPQKSFSVSLRPKNNKIEKISQMRASRPPMLDKKDTKQSPENLEASDFTEVKAKVSEVVNYDFARTLVSKEVFTETFTNNESRTIPPGFGEESHGPRLKMGQKMISAHYNFLAKQNDSDDEIAPILSLSPEEEESESGDHQDPPTSESELLKNSQQENLAKNFQNQRTAMSQNLRRDQRRIPTITVSKPDGHPSNSISGGPADISPIKFQAAESSKMQPPPNFRYVNSTVSVESRLKFLSDVYTELIDQPEVKEIIDAVGKVFSKDELIQFEEDEFDEMNTHRFVQDKQEEEIIKVSLEEETQSKNQLNRSMGGENDRQLSDRMVNRSSVSSLQSIRIEQQYIDYRIDKKAKQIISKRLEYMKYFVFAVLVVVSVTLRININFSFETFKVEMQKASILGYLLTPASYLFKETSKLRLFEAGLVNKRVSGRELGVIDPLVLTNMEVLVAGNYSWLMENTYSGVSLGKHELASASGVPELGMIQKISFFTMLTYMIQDFKILEESYSEASPELFEPNPRLNMGSIRVNSLEMVYQSSDDLRFLMTSSSSLSNEFYLNYVAFISSNLFLTLIISLILVVMNLSITNETNMMASLLLKIDKGALQALLDRFCKVLNSIKEINQKKIFGEENRDYQKTRQLRQLELQRQQQAKEKVRDKKKLKKRAKFSHFKSKFKNSQLVVFFVIILTIVAVNIPIGIDFMINLVNMKKVEKLNKISEISGLLSQEVYAFYGVFYTEALARLHEGSAIEEKVEVLKEYVLETVQSRDQLQQLISRFPKLAESESMSVCDFVDVRKLVKGAEAGNRLNQSCLLSINFQDNYNVFMALSELNNYYKTVMASLGQERQLDILKTDDFFIFDSSIYFVSESLHKMNVESLEMVGEILSQNLLVALLFFFLFAVFLILYFLLYRLVLIRSKKRLLRKLECVYLVLPSDIIAGNSYLINFFRLRRNRNLA